MSCRDIEALMADALGGELSNADRPRFEKHLSECSVCREEYDSLSGALDRMRSLPESKGAGTFPAMESVAMRRVAGGGLRWGAVLRYAAGLLIAFGAGYWFHGGTSESPSIEESSVTRPADNGRPTLEAALVRSYQQRPGRSALSTAMMAMFAGE